MGVRAGVVIFVRNITLESHAHGGTGYESAAQPARALAQRAPTPSESDSKREPPP